MGNNVNYEPNPNPHPQAKDAPGTGVPINPAGPRVSLPTEAREIIAGEK